MQQVCGVLVMALLAPCLAGAQGLPPSVILLRRIKDHLKREFSSLPNYTCLETAQRLNKRPGPKSTLRSVDTVRLEVLNTGSHELYAAPGESDFREDSPFAFSTNGLAASGLFASFVQTLFVHDNGIFKFEGEQAADSTSLRVRGDEGFAASLLLPRSESDRLGRRTVRYDYTVPLLSSGWHIQLAHGGGDVAMKGAVWIDADSLDLVRLKVQADDIPVTLRINDATIVLDYARTRIGEADVLLPQSGEVSMEHKSGEFSRNLLDYTHCRNFQAQSTLSFAVSEVRFDTPAAAQPAPRADPLPGGLTVNIRLSTALSDKLAIGSSVEGTVTTAVADRGKVLIPAGAKVSGRIRRLDRGEQSGGFHIGLEFTEIRSERGVYRFYAGLESVAAVGVEVFHEGEAASRLPGVGFLFVRGATLALRPGLQLTWKTRAQTR